MVTYIILCALYHLQVIQFMTAYHDYQSDYCKQFYISVILCFVDIYLSG